MTFCKIRGDHDFPHVLIRRATFSPDGSKIVTARSGDGTARIWDVESGSQLQILKGHRRFTVMHAAFAPDGSRIVTASDDKTARIYLIGFVDLLDLAKRSLPMGFIDKN
ncbi:MAG: hypothetical protein V3U91_05875 [Candidatus Aminicenantaceae bacterium]